MNIIRVADCKRILQLVLVVLLRTTISCCGMLLSLGMCSKKNLIYNKKIIITRHTLVWKGILVAVFFPLSGYSIWVMVAPIIVKLCIMVRIGPGQILSPFGGGIVRRIPKSEILGLTFGHLTAYILKAVSHSVTCQLELNISSTGAF